MNQTYLQKLEKTTLGSNAMSEKTLKPLESKIDELIAFCAHLQEENTGLRSRESGLLKERTELIEKNQVARQKVESIIARLKTMQEG